MSSQKHALLLRYAAYARGLREQGLKPLSFEAWRALHGPN